MLTIALIEVDDPLRATSEQFTQPNFAASFVVQSYAARNRIPRAATLSVQPHNSGAETFAFASHGLADDRIDALIVPSGPGEPWFASASYEEVLRLISDCCSGTPEYAVPRAVVVSSLQEATDNRLLTNGRPARKQIEKFVVAKAASAPSLTV